MRTFLAIELPDEVRDALVRLGRQIRVGRMVAPENLHLTLAFLGEQDEETLAALHECLEAGPPFPGFDLRLAGLGVFGGRSPRALYVAADPSPGLMGLHRAILAGLRQVGIEPERRRYRPHVTLARFGKGLDRTGSRQIAGFLESRAGFALPPFRVGGYALLRSILHPAGARYEVLADYPLGLPGAGGGETGG